MNIVNDEEKTFSLSEGIFENEFVLLDNHNANIVFKRENVEIKLTELQRRFMFTLLKGVNKKTKSLNQFGFIIMKQSLITIITR
ncbi:MAG: hypothetical protein XXXJIFNMEKO3_03242 [Candidatus Erwinia impunctatus]|nr:hypothetical protein XXXJIFNMEKO_03242 [Culicoides impunctatus]